MEPSRYELTLEESIKEVMHILPAPIRHYLGQKGYSVVVQDLTTKYNLHPDQENVLEREIILLLMGIENPDEFSGALITEAGLDQQTVSSIAQDVNIQIFIPLRAQMQNGGGNITQPMRSVTPPVAQPKVAPPAPNYAPPMPASAPPPPAPRPVQRVTEIPQPSVIIQANPSLPVRPAQAAASMLRRTPLPPRPIMPPRPSAPHAVAPPSPSQQRPVGARMMLEDHEEASPSLRQAPRVAAPILPTGFKPPVPAQRVYTPPSNLPGTMPSPGVPTTPPPPPVPLTPKPPIASYSTDPYREPVDEPPAE